jgi:hypothetical protein
MLAAMADTVGLQGDVPAALGFIEPAEQEIHLLMQDTLRMIARLKALGTLAEWYIKGGHMHILISHGATICTHCTPTQTTVEGVADKSGSCFLTSPKHIYWLGARPALVFTMSTDMLAA